MRAFFALGHSNAQSNASSINRCDCQAGCSLSIPPDPGRHWDLIADTDATQHMEMRKIKKAIFCRLRDAVHLARCIPIKPNTRAKSSRQRRISRFPIPGAIAINTDLHRGRREQAQPEHPTSTIRQCLIERPANSEFTSYRFLRNEPVEQQMSRKYAVISCSVAVIIGVGYYSYKKASENKGYATLLLSETSTGAFILDMYRSLHNDIKQLFSNGVRTDPIETNKINYSIFDAKQSSKDRKATAWRCRNSW